MADALRVSQEPPNQSPEDEAFCDYMEALRRELEQNWDNGYAQMPHEVRNDPSLSPKAKIVYEQLLSYMWFKTDRCWPSQETIAEATGYSRRTVIRAIQELYDRGYIERWRRGLGLTNYYFVNPLSFVRSFRPIPGPRTATLLPHHNVILAQDSALRQDMSTAMQRPAEPHYPEVTECHNGSDAMAQQEMPESHTKYTQTNLQPLELKKGSTRSGRAAELGTGEGVGPKTIRKAQNEKGIKKDTNEEPNQSNPTNSNPKPIASQETSGAAQVKDVKEVRRSRRTKHAPGEVPPALSEYLEHVFLDPISTFFCDQARASSKTSFAWIYDEFRKRGLDEYCDTLHDLINEARDETKVRASRGEIRGRNRDGSIAMMPYFLSVLETNVNAWCKSFDKAVAQQAAQAESTNGKPLGRESDHKEDEQQLPATPTPPIEENHQQQTGFTPSSPASVVAQVEPQEAAPQRYIATNDPTHGWSAQNAVHFADKLRDLLGSTYWHCHVVPTLAAGRYGFVLVELATGKEWEYITMAQYDEALRSIRANRQKAKRAPGWQRW